MRQTLLKKRLREWLNDLGHSPQKKKARRSLALAGAALVALWVFGGSQGLISLASTIHETWTLKREIAELEKQHLELEARQANLLHDRAYYEKFAREKLNLKEPGEIVFRFDKK